MIPKRIEEELRDGETLLWWGKPSVKIMWDEEKIGLKILIYLVLFMALSMSSSFFRSFHKLWIHLPLVVGALLLAVAVFYLVAYFKKENTWFVITDQRAMIVREKGIRTVSKPLRDIMFFENQPMRYGGVLHMGKYRRYSATRRLNYEKNCINDFMSDGDIWRIGKDKALDYFCFYSLEDPTPPRRSSANGQMRGSYSDPKLKKRV